MIRYKLNIFVLDEHPAIAASYANDMHVSKMTTEAAQMLSTITRIYSFVKQDSHLDSLLYKRTHTSHPCVIWAGANEYNYRWLYQHFEGLANEYERRFGKEHESWLKLGSLLSTVPKDLVYQSPIQSQTPADSLFSPEILMPQPSLTVPRLVVSPELMKAFYGGAYFTPEDLERLDEANRVIAEPMPETWSNVVTMYREYYFTSKFHLAKWTNRPIPDWFQTKADRIGKWKEQVVTRKIRGNVVETRSILFV
jgi:hypothetical protein